MGLGTSSVKHILLLINLLLTVLGLILIGYGIFILVSGSENKVDHGENLAGGLIITLGVVILLLIIFGSLAAIHESRNRLIIFIISLSVLILIQLAMNAMASPGTNDGLSASVKEGFDELWEIEQKEPGALAYYEEWLHCCGVNNTRDYREIGHDIPKTCCVQRNCRVAENIYKEGCQEKFEEYLADKMVVFCIVSWILIVAEVVSAVFAFMLWSSLRNQSRRENVGWM